MTRSFQRAAVSAFLGVSVLLASVLSGCFMCAGPAYAQTTHAGHPCCPTTPVKNSCHVPPKQAPVQKDCDSNRLDLGSIEHSQVKPALIELGTATVASPAPPSAAAAPEWFRALPAAGPPGLHSVPDILTLESTFRI